MSPVCTCVLRLLLRFEVSISICDVIPRIALKLPNVSLAAQKVYNALVSVLLFKIVQIALLPYTKFDQTDSNFFSDLILARWRR